MEYQMYTLTETNGKISIFEEGKLIYNEATGEHDKAGIRRLLEAANGNAEAHTKTRKLLRGFNSQGDTNL